MNNEQRQGCCHYHGKPNCTCWQAARPQDECQFPEGCRIHGPGVAEGQVVDS